MSQGHPERVLGALGAVLGGPWGLPGHSLGAAWEALGRAWETPRDDFGVKVDPKLHDFASIFFEAVFWTFYSSLSFFCFPQP